MSVETVVNVKHEQVRLHSSYDAFIKNLESIVKNLDVKYAREAMTDPRKVEADLQSLEKDTGLIIFGTQNHGAILNIKGKPRKAIQYIIGNPLVAIQMTVHDIRTALYAPLRMPVFEDSNQQAFVEYDLPSTLFGQFGNDAVLKVGLDLDVKLLNVITLADKL